MEAASVPTVLILALACYRISRLISVDTIFGRARLEVTIWLASRGVIGRFLRDLIMCPLCVGVWVAGALTVVADIIWGVQAPVLVWAAVAGLQCWMAATER